ncbi:MAG: alpha-ketoglutarate-dependent dioxygenase AlkB [Silicimonas sp.]|nr:alpha-ketoglutarate-dependent dioxygenase AlkB [Silicimonas sp.]
MRPSVDLNGVGIWKDLLSRVEQEQIVNDLRSVAKAAPFQQYETGRGHKMSVRMTGAGDVAWVSDRRGYRYEPVQKSGVDWPKIPDTVLNVWNAVSGIDRTPDSCLVNYYGQGACMGLHQDKDEADLKWPVVSISLGDDALFRVGQVTRGGPTQSVWLRSGDVAVLRKEARLAYHGIDRIKFGTSSLLPDGGRINVTLRVAG